MLARRAGCVQQEPMNEVLTIAIAGTLALGGGGIAGAAIAPPVAPIFPPDEPSQPLAQARGEYTDDQIERYTKAVMAIENKRLQVYASAKRLTEWRTISNLAGNRNAYICNLDDTDLTDSLQSLCRDFFSYSRQVVKSHGFDPATFNRMTRDQQTNTKLRDRIQAKMIELSTQ